MACGPIAMSPPTAHMWTDNLQEQKRVLKKWDRFLAGAALPVHQPRERIPEVSCEHGLLSRAKAVIDRNVQMICRLQILHRAVMISSLLLTKGVWDVWSNTDAACHHICVDRQTQF